MSLKQYLFNEDKDSIKKSIHKVVSLKIKESVGVKLDDFSIQNINISRFKRLHIKFLYDERTTKEKKEFNFSGINVNRKVKKTDIVKFDYQRNDYKFSNLDKVREFRIDDSDQTQICNLCNGNKTILCNECRGGGKLRCDECYGRGEKRCSSCGGRGDSRCFWCGGKGYKTTGYGDTEKKERCNSCSGTGRQKCTNCTNGQVQCTRCYGTGQVTCYICNGRGNVPCYNCEATGSFIHFLTVMSTLNSIENIMYLDVLPKNEFLVKNLIEEEHEYSKNYNDINLNKLSEYISEFKDLYGDQKFQDYQRAELVLFTLQECVSLTFTIKIGNSTYNGWLKDGKIWFDQTIINFLVYDIIDGLKLNQNFELLKPIKKALSNKIPDFTATWGKILEFDKLTSIIKSNDSVENKILASRELKLIDNTTFIKNQCDIFMKRFNASTLVLLGVFTIVPFLVILIQQFNYNGFTPKFQSIDTALFVLYYSLSYFIFVIVSKYTRNNLRKNDPNNTKKNGFVLLVFLIAINSISCYYVSLKLEDKGKEIKEAKSIVKEFEEYKRKHSLTYITLHPGFINQVDDTIIIIRKTGFTKQMYYLMPESKYLSYDSHVYENGTWVPIGDYKEQIADRQLLVEIDIRSIRKTPNGRVVDATFYGLGTDLEVYYDDINKNKAPLEIEVEYMRNSIEAFKRMETHKTYILESDYK